MEGAERLIEAYELLLQQSQSMLELARAGDWASLVREKALGLIDIEQLRQLEGRITLGPREQQRKVELLEQILELDGEIRARLTARRNELGEQIMLSRRQSQLNRAYASGATEPVVFQAARRFEKGLM